MTLQGENVTVLMAAAVMAGAGLEASRCDVSLLARDPWLTRGATSEIALRFDIEPGWHIYWLNPGDTGMATEVDWSVPEGHRVKSVRWSRPHRFESDGIVSYGYENAAYAIVEVETAGDAPLGEVTIRAKADWLICKDVCLPGKGESTLTIPVKAEGPPLASMPPQPWLDALAAMPLNGPQWALRATRALDGMTLWIENLRLDRYEIGRAYFFALGSEVVAHAAPQILERRNGAYILALPKTAYTGESPERLKGVLELNFADGRTMAIDVDIPIQE
jgi:DsbC/DsbD-like thiol-disulfide interchange protein